MAHRWPSAGFNLRSLPSSSSTISAAGRRSLARIGGAGRPFVPQSRQCPTGRRLAFSTVADQSSALSALEPALDTTHSLLQSLHDATSLPWVVVLPLAALLVRAVSTAPVAIYARRVQQRQLELQPLLFAWMHQLQRQIVRQHPGRLGLKAYEKRVMAAVQAKQRELYRRWRCGRWRVFLPPFGYMPVFLIMIETIRRMCGTRSGLLGLLFARKAQAPANGGGGVGGGGVGGSGDGDVVDGFVGGNPNSAHDVTAGFWSNSSSNDDVVATVIESAGPSVTTDAGVVTGLEASFASEGGLWFHDLLAPDPLFVLPFILSGMLLANATVATRAASKVAIVSNNNAQAQQQPPFQRRLAKALKVLALVMAPATLQVPSAIMVYWISSSAFALCQNVLVDRLMPLKPLLPPRTQVLSPPPSPPPASRIYSVSSDIDREKH